MAHGHDYLQYNQYAGDTALMATAMYEKVTEHYLEWYERERRRLNKDRKERPHRNAGRHSLKVCAPYYLKVPPFWEPENHDNADYVTLDAVYSLQLYTKFTELLQKEDTYNFYQNYLLPWARMFLRAEVRGVQLDIDLINKLGPEYEQQAADYKAQLDAMWKGPREQYKEKKLVELKDKYQGMFCAARAKLKDKYTPEKETRLKEKYSALYEAAAERADVTLNYDSPSQLKWVLRDALDLDITGLDGEESTDKEVLELLVGKGRQDVALLLKYRESTKIVGTYFAAYKELADKTGAIHTSFNLDIARTGRTSCIAKGTLVQIPGGAKPIEKIKVGDYVYSYTNEGVLVLKRVVRHINNGIKACIKIKWQSSGNGAKLGELTCTPDHLLKHKTKGWVPADSCKRGDKIYHLHRGSEKRPRLYGTNSLMVQEQIVIKKELFNAPDAAHIHHIDGNPTNNFLNNLAIVFPSAHVKIHGQIPNTIGIRRTAAARKGKAGLLTATRRLNISRLSLLRLLAKTRGTPTKIPIDYGTLINMTKKYGISLKTVAERYSPSGKYLGKGKIIFEFKRLGGCNRVARSLGIRTPKLKRLCNIYGIAYNHQVLSVKPAGLQQVFDLEVEDTHNFIAGELCVHNCSTPNLQNQPRELHELFVARPGYVLITKDLSAIEPSVVAFYSEDPLLVDLIKQGGDFHGYNCNAILGTDYDLKTLKKLYPKERDLAKEVGLAVLYGAGRNRIYACSTKRGFRLSLNECAAGVERLRDAWPDVIRFKRAVDELADRGEPITNLFGRKRVFETDEVYMKAFNSLIQGTASDLLLESTRQAQEEFDKLGIDAHLLMTVHDEVIFEVPADLVDKCDEIITKQMTKWELPTPMGAVPLRVEGKASQRWEK
jgi:DNA polymerase I-like protein with 3'-5' exonuclease and polymerase domains